MTPEFRLFEYWNAIPNDLKTPFARWNKVDRRGWKALAKLSRQTDGSGLVVSNGAVFDLDLHFALSA